MLKTKVVRFLFNHRTLPKRAIAKLFPNPILLKLTGFKMYVYLDDWAVGARIAVNRTYEEHVSREIRQYLIPGTTFVDVGANIGYYSLLAASCLKNTGKILAFEPSAKNCHLLKTSIEENGFKNVEIHLKAVADVNGMVGFKMDDSNGSISKNITDDYAFQVEAITLDHALAEENQVDLIKIDVEGAEGLVIMGAEKIIQTHRPVIFTEFRPPAIENRSEMPAQAFLDRLRHHGYALQVISKTEVVNSLPQSNQEILACYEAVKPSHIDLLAIPQ
ncbi:FkbM family methyltransferase [Candidatus Leptofilum sp.]|uniref:FkbM family methyltransferase n=1 Tax=Candidatus Leptofilum sp. TaxID=3241576 RepID=UPI003B5A8846